MGEFVGEATVLKVSKKATSGKGHVYNIQIETDDNGKEWWGCGFEDPKVNEGDIIEFELIEVGDYTNVDLDTIVVLEAAPKRERSSRGRGNDRDSGRSSGGRGGRDSGRSSGNSRSGSSRGNSRSSGRGDSAAKGRGASRSGADKKPAVDWDRKDNLIRLQSSQNTAIALVGMLLTNGALKLPAKQADKRDAAVAAVEKEAARLFDKYTDIVDGNYDDGTDDGRDQYDDDDDIPE